MADSCDLYSLTVFAFACDLRHWLITTCSAMLLLTFIGAVWVWRNLRKDVKRLEFATWKIEQLADRIRMQEPNSSYVESITKKLQEEVQIEQKESLDHFMIPSLTRVPVVKNQDFHSMVQQQKEVDEQKVLKESGVHTPLIAAEQPENGSKVMQVTREITDLLISGSPPAQKVASPKQKSMSFK